MAKKSTYLAHYNPSLSLRLASDSSAYGLGSCSFACVSRWDREASRTLSSSEQNYAQLEREALALVFGVKKLHPYLFGRDFQLLTDHKPLTTILGPKTGIPSLAVACLQRWALMLSGYKYQIKYKPTKCHGNADALSRLPLRSDKLDDSISTSTIFNIHQIEALPVTSKQIADAL